MNEWRNTHKEEVNANARKYYVKHKEQIKSLKEIWYRTEKGIAYLKARKEYNKKYRERLKQVKCTIIDCGKTIFAKGKCSYHYTQEPSMKARRRAREKEYRKREYVKEARKQYYKSYRERQEYKTRMKQYLSQYNTVAENIKHKKIYAHKYYKKNKNRLRTLHKAWLATENGKLHTLRNNSRLGKDAQIEIVELWNLNLQLKREVRNYEYA